MFNSRVENFRLYELLFYYSESLNSILLLAHPLWYFHIQL